MAYIVVSLFLLKYIVQIFLYVKNRKQRITSIEKPEISCSIILILGLMLFSIFIIRSSMLGNHIMGLSVLLIGLTIGALGIINLGRNFNNELTIFENGYLVKNGIFKYVRHPIRLGICLEVLSLAIFINSIFPMLFIPVYFYLNYRRTIVEENFLIKIYKNEAEEYFRHVPRFNILKGLFVHFKRPLKNVAFITEKIDKYKNRHKRNIDI